MLQNDSMHSDASCFRNPLSPPPFVGASFTHTHYDNSAINFSVFFFNIYKIFLSRHSINLYSFFLQWISSILKTQIRPPQHQIEIILKAAICQTMAFDISVEINNDTNSTSTKISSLKVLYNICCVKKKRINFEQYAQLHFEGPKIAICERAPDALFVIDTSFTTKYTVFKNA